MDYIINPIWFYLLQIVSTLKVVTIIFAVISGPILITLSIGCTSEQNFYYKDNYLSACSWKKKLTIPFFICLFLGIFIPTETTITRMMVAQFATYDNAQVVITKITEGAKYIVDSIASMSQGS